jgi:ABC-type uncharacterized transport system auxiliary subunit
MNNQYLLAALAMATALCGCGVAKQIQTRQAYEQSASAYRECLIANQANPQACEGKQVVMDADEHYLETFQPTDNISTRSTVTVQSR